MSKCPLQLYLNDKYLESSPSVQTSNNVFKKTFKKCRENGLLNTQKYQGNGFFENDKCKVLDKPNGHKNRTVLDEYLAEHSKSIAAYHNLQKQQEEVLNLCKQKIAKRFPSSVRAVLKDEDIINALRIAENSDCHVVESKKSGDRLVHAVLNAIMSNVHHHLNPQNSDCNSNQTYQKEDKQLRGVSPSDFLNPKKKSVFSKFVRFFGKSNNQKAYLTSSDNYFNNSKYTIDSNPMGVVPYTGKTNEQNDNSSNHGDKKQTFKYMLNKFAGDSWHASKSMQSDTSTNLSEAINQTFGKRNKQYLTYYCTYQRDVDLLKSEIQKQKSEIKSIQKNLNRCLNILKAFEEKGNKGNKNDMFNTNTTAYHVLTPNEYRGYHNPAEPYSRYYPHYRAELETTYDGQGSTSNYRSNSSNDAQKKKCCCFKCNKKKKKKKNKLQPKREYSKRHVVTETTEHDQTYYREEDESPPVEIQQLEAPTDGSKRKSAADTRRGVTTSSETMPSNESKRARRKRLRKQRREERRLKRRRKRCPESTGDSAADATPRRQPCMIRFCKFLFCSSCCT